MEKKSERITFGAVVMSSGEAKKKRKKVVSRESSGNAKLFVDKDAKKRPDIPENSIVFPYSSKEQAPEMATVIQRICIGSVPWENEKSKIAHTDLTPTYRMINRIVACNIHPRGHTVEIAYDTAQLLYAIAEHEVIIDLPLYIFNHVREASAVEDDRPCLPFPILVSKILKHNVVEFQQNDSFIYPMNPMGMGTLNKSVEAILGVKQGKCVKQAAAVP
ncbi:unnamed protein product [Ilex paraguariensis]|uniref:Putative plant transposon protein domain-containing protein n=1 Tax=Ilex paraguariensis TaxID=185542 RepID=A0ABC8RKL6_9AQUA